MPREPMAIRQTKEKSGKWRPIVAGAWDGLNGGSEVCFLPFQEKNPYQTRLAECLSREGFVVTRATGIFRIILDRMSGTPVPDIVHLHWLPRFSDGWMGWLQAIRMMVMLRVLRLSGTRIVWTVHNLHSHESPQIDLERCVAESVASLAEGIIVHTKEAADRVGNELRNIDCEKITVIPHGNYIGSYRNVATKEEARNRLGVPMDATVFCFLGLIRPYKGISELIDAFRELEDDNCRLVIAGKPIHEDIENEAARRVAGDARIRLMHEFVPDDEMEIYLNSADVMVFPYKHSLTSGAVVLAMSFGKACLAPAIGCLPEMIGKNGGVTYVASDANGLRDAMRIVIARRDELDGMGLDNFGKASLWTWENSAKLSASVYRKALQCGV